MSMLWTRKSITAKKEISWLKTNISSEKMQINDTKNKHPTQNNWINDCSKQISNLTTTTKKTSTTTTTTTKLIIGKKKNLNADNNKN